MIFMTSIPKCSSSKSHSSELSDFLEWQVIWHSVCVAEKLDEFSSAANSQRVGNRDIKKRFKY